MKNKLIVGFIWFLIIYVIGDWAFNIYDPLTMLSDISDRGHESGGFMVR